MSCTELDLVMEARYATPAGVGWLVIALPPPPTVPSPGGGGRGGRCGNRGVAGGEVVDGPRALKVADDEAEGPDLTRRLELREVTVHGLPTATGLPGRLSVCTLLVGVRMSTSKRTLVGTNVEEPAKCCVNDVTEASASVRIILASLRCLLMLDGSKVEADDAFASRFPCLDSLELRRLAESAPFMMDL